jgi:aminoglycoside 6'-N-acetyltransferase I
MTMRATIRVATELDLEDVVALAFALWPDEDEEDLLDSLAASIDADAEIVFLAVVDGESVGFAAASLRTDYVEGASSSPVGYLEGVYVDEAYRRRGIGQALVRAVESWAALEGCTEFGSDAYLENLESHAFHLSAGFEEAGRLVHFLKPLPQVPLEG